MIRVLMICHGNICRSTMAEFVLKDIVKKRGLSEKFIINSAGTSTEELGNDTHYGTKAKLKEENVEFTKRRAVQVKKSDYDKYDYLICMDRNNIKNLEKIIKRDTDNKVHLLLDFTNSTGNIADPWYTHNFDETYYDVEKGCLSFLEHLTDSGVI